jgi:hypothetical protein
MEEQLTHMLDTIPSVGPEKNDAFPTFKPELNKKIFKPMTKPARIAVAPESTNPATALSGIG